MSITGIKLIENVKEQRQEWKSLRKTTIGSSEIVTVCGLNPYSSPLELWAQKTGKIAEVEENEWMRLGTYMEPFIGDFFAREMNMHVMPANALYGHPQIKWATASPDFFALTKPAEGDFSGAGQMRIVEAKNVSAHRHHEYQEGNCPNGPHMQVVWQLGVLGLEVGYVAALVGAAPNNFYHPEITFDCDLFDQMLELGVRFMTNLEADIPPAAKGNDKEILEKLVKREQGKEVDLPQTCAPILAQYFEAKQALKELQGKLDIHQQNVKNAEALLLQALNGASIGHFGETTVKATRVETKGHFVKGSAYTRVTVKI